MEYAVEFTQTVIVDADNREDAVFIALAEVSDADSKTDIRNFYVYVDGKGGY